MVRMKYLGDADRIRLGVDGKWIARGEEVEIGVERARRLAKHGHTFVPVERAEKAAKAEPDKATPKE